MKERFEKLDALERKYGKYVEIKQRKEIKKKWLWKTWTEVEESSVWLWIERHIVPGSKTTHLFEVSIADGNTIWDDPKVNYRINDRGQITFIEEFLSRWVVLEREPYRERKVVLLDRYIDQALGS